MRAMFDRIAGVYDLMNTVMTAGLHHRWRARAADLAARRAGRPRARRRHRHRRPRDRAGAPRRRPAARWSAATSPRRCSTRARAQGAGRCASSGPTRSRCPTPTTASTRRRSASARATSPTSSAGCARWRASCARAGAWWCSRSRTPTRPPLSRFYRALVRPASCPRARARLAGDRRRLQLPAELGAALPRPGRAGAAMERAGLRRDPLRAHRRRHHRDPRRHRAGGRR